MKRKLFLLVTLIMLSITGQSQALWILIFGDKLSNDFMQSGINISITSSRLVGLDDSKAFYSWAIGSYTDFLLNDNWAISLEMTIKSPTGASGLNKYYTNTYISDSLLTKQNTSIETTNFALPIYLKYHTKYLNFGIGPQFILAYKSSKKYKATTFNNKNVTVIDNSKDLINKFDMGLSAMVEFYLFPKKPQNSIKIGLEYFHGFMPALKDYSDATNSVVQLKVGIPIVGKKDINKNN